MRMNCQCIDIDRARFLQGLSMGYGVVSQCSLLIHHSGKACMGSVIGSYQHEFGNLMVFHFCMHFLNFGSRHVHSLSCILACHKKCYSLSFLPFYGHNWIVYLTYFPWFWLYIISLSKTSTYPLYIYQQFRVTFLERF